MRPLPVLAALAPLACASSVAAEEVSFEQAIALAARSPEVEASRRALRARERGDADIGGTAEATTVTVLPGGVVTPPDARGFELQLTATQGWNLADLGRVRRRAAAQERRGLAARVRAEALRVRIDAARAWIELRTLELLWAVLDEQAEVAQRLVERTERAVRAGAMTLADLAEARASAAEITQRRLAVEGERFDTAVRLALAMGVPAAGHAGPVHRGGDHDATGLATAGPMPDPDLPPVPALRVRIASLDALPEVAAQRLAATAARAREAEAAAERAPVLDLGAHLERTASDEWIVYGVAGLRVHLFGEASRAVSQARAETARAIEEARSARLVARAELVAAVHEVEHSRRVLAALESELVPTLEALRERRERALEVGEATVFEALIARSRALSAREQLERAQGAAAWAEVRMWLLLAELSRAPEDAP